METSRFRNPSLDAAEQGAYAVLPEAADAVADLGAVALKRRRVRLAAVASLSLLFVAAVALLVTLVPDSKAHADAAASLVKDNAATQALLARIAESKPVVAVTSSHLDAASLAALSPLGISGLTFADGASVSSPVCPHSGRVFAKIEGVLAGTVAAVGASPRVTLSLHYSCVSQKKVSLCPSPCHAVSHPMFSRPTHPLLHTPPPPPPPKKKNNPAATAAATWCR